MPAHSVGTITVSVKLMTTYPCGCEILQFGNKVHRYDVKWCNMHAHAGVLVDQARVAVRALIVEGCGPKTQGDLAEGLNAALRLMGKAE